MNIKRILSLDIKHTEVKETSSLLKKGFQNKRKKETRIRFQIYMQSKNQLKVEYNSSFAHEVNHDEMLKSPPDKLLWNIANDYHAIKVIN